MGLGFGVSVFSRIYRFGEAAAQTGGHDLLMTGNWQEAKLKPPLSKWAWTLWRYDWTPVHEGDFSIRLRAYSRSEKIQESPSLLGRVLSSTYPEGARGIHAVQVHASGT